MKKSYLVLIVALTVVVITLVWLFSTGSAFSRMEIVQPGIIGLLLIFAVSWLVIRWKGIRSE